MIVDLGAFAFSLVGPLLLLGAVSGLRAWAKPEGPAGLIQDQSVRLALPIYTLILISLIWALVINDFDLLFVAQNTNPSTPLLYKIVGVWGNHEGSLILWQLMLVGFAALMTRKPMNMPMSTHRLALSFFMLLILGFYGFSALLANPFMGNGSVPPGSGDLNVLLQDIGQIIHPPMLYLGYTASAATFVLAIAVLLDSQISAEWDQWLRPWALVSWTFLTAGIALGSFWAYYELGWGGWWFWDPVENLALLPWLLGTALIHSLQVVRARRQLLGWSLLLALLTFLMVMLGTFIVRSGLLTSVHAFASDPDRGLYLLIVLIFTSGLALFAYGYGVRRDLPAQAALTLNRQGVLLINNLLIMALFSAVIAGTLAPTFIELVGGETYVVRERFYTPTFVYPSLALLTLMSVGVWTRFSREGVGGALSLLLSFAGLLALAFALSFSGAFPIRAGLMFALGTWVLTSTVGAWYQQNQGRLMKASLSSHGWALAHIGLAVAVLGMSASTLLSQERIFELDGAQMREFFGQTFFIHDRFWLPGENFQSLTTAIEVEGRGVRLAETRLYHPVAAMMNPAQNAEDLQFLADQGQPANEAAIFRGLFADIFINVQDRAGGAPLMTIARKVGINWIWAGAVLMSLGGGLCLIPRRGGGTKADSK